MPRILALIFNLITIFLTIFLLVGCYNMANQATFLTRYEFDQSSPFYSVIKSSFAAGNKTTGLEKVVIKSGYMGICLEDVPRVYNFQGQEATEACFSRKSVSNNSLFTDLSIELFNIPSTSNNKSTSNKSSTPVKLNILQLAQMTSVNVVHPYILMATIILTIILFLLILYAIVPSLPFKIYLSRFTLILSPVLVLIWGLGSIWAHVGIRASYKFIPAASMGIIKVHKGKKSATMTWFSFAFLLIDCIILWALYLRDRKNLDEEIDKVNATKNSNPYDYYGGSSSSNSSSLHSKV